MHWGSGWEDLTAMNERSHNLAENKMSSNYKSYQCCKGKILGTLIRERSIGELVLIYSLLHLLMNPY